MTPESDIDPVAAETAPVSSTADLPQGPGRLVQIGRERASVSVEELAQQTKLARFTIEALERDDFAVLNEAVYIRGYYRKVAKALSMPEAELLAAYAAKVAPQAPPAPTKLLLGSGDNSATRTRRRGGRGLLLTVVAVVVLLIVGVSLYNRQSATATKAGVAKSSATLGTAKSSTGGGTGPAALATTSVGGSATDSPASNVAPSAVPEPSAAPAAPLPVAPPAGDAAAAPADAESKTLDLDFTASSWVHIEDASGKLLLSGVVQAGAHQSVSGHMPMSVFLGNAHGVVVSSQGKPIDIAPYIKDNATARFSVP